MNINVDLNKAYQDMLDNPALVAKMSELVMGKEMTEMLGQAEKIVKLVQDFVDEYEISEYDDVSLIGEYYKDVFIRKLIEALPK